MSELMKTAARPGGKRNFLATVSAIALITGLPKCAMAGEGRPTVWFEAGAQLERLTNGQESFAPPFVATLLENPFTSPNDVQRTPRYSIGEEARISINPEGSEWSFSAAIRYGRTNRRGNVHEQTLHPSVIVSKYVPALGIDDTTERPALANRFANTVSQMNSTHLVLDFMTGRDVGLGAFGMHGSSTIDVGVRFAQFTSQSKVNIDSDPDFAVTYKYHTTFSGSPAHIKLPQQNWDLYSGKMNVARSFSGAGPSLAWAADATILGSPQSGSFTLDWGLNGSVLFGRQKALAHHETMAHHKSFNHASGALPTLYPSKSRDSARSRSIVVPNVGAFAGLSLRFPNAKVSMGYRIDAFFGAVDGGIDARKTYDRDFYGPFATISIGLGG